MTIKKQFPLSAAKIYEIVLPDTSVNAGIGLVAFNKVRREYGLMPSMGYSDTSKSLRELEAAIEEREGKPEPEEPEKKKWFES